MAKSEARDDGRGWKGRKGEAKRRGRSWKEEEREEGKKRERKDQ